MMLAAAIRPDFRALNSFRLRPLEALGVTFPQVLPMCHQEGLVTLDHAAVDGTRLTANVGTHAAMSDDRCSPSEVPLARGLPSAWAPGWPV